MHESRKSQLNFFANSAAMCTRLPLLAFYCSTSLKTASFHNKASTEISENVVSQRAVEHGRSIWAVGITYIVKSNDVLALTLGGSEFRRELAVAGRFQFPKV